MKGTNMFRKRKDYIVRVIFNDQVENIQVKAKNRREAMQMVKEVLLKCDVFGFKSSDEFELICKKERRANCEL